MSDNEGNYDKESSKSVNEYLPHEWIETVTYVWDYPSSYFPFTSLVFPDTKALSKWKLVLASKKGRYSPYFCSLLLHIAECCVCVECLDVAQLKFEILNKKDSVFFTSATFNHVFKKPFEPYEFPGDLVLDDTKVNPYKLRVSFQVKILEEKHDYKNSHFKFITDLEKMLTSGAYSDFIIKVDNTEIAVHKNILAARSAVFAAMFENDTSEKKEGYVKILDMDKSTVSSMIKFIYTTELDISTIEEAEKLFFAADKYELLDLKYECEKHFIKNLNISDVPNVLIFAERHSAMFLKDKAIDFIIQNKDYFKRNERFQKLLEVPTLLVELLQKI